MLEACQFHHNGPCALLAVDDTLQPAPADGRLVRRDMARVRYDRHFDPERIPAVRPNVIGRPDVASYRAATGPKAAAFHPWGRLFVATAATSQRTAEEQALAACNADPSRKGADGPCFLYAVGNKVILPRRLTAPRPPAATIGEAISVLVADRNLASNYAAENDNKALAIEPESGRSFRSGGVPYRRSGGTHGARGMPDQLRAPVHSRRFQRSVARSRSARRRAARYAARAPCGGLSTRQGADALVQRRAGHAEILWRRTRDTRRWRSGRSERHSLSR